MAEPVLKVENLKKYFPIKGDYSQDLEERVKDLSELSMGLILRYIAKKFLP